MKKFLAFLMAFAVIGSVLAGCGGGDKTKNSLTLLPAEPRVPIIR